MENNTGFIAQNIAYYLDSDYSVITFGMSVMEDYMFNNFLLPDILRNVKSKKIITTTNPNNGILADMNFEDSVFIIDLDEITNYYSKGIPSVIERARYIHAYTMDLRKFCTNSRNSVIIKKSIFYTFGTESLSPNSIAYASDVILMIDKGVIKSTKNRFGERDIINNNLFALMREQKINEILED